MPRTSGETVPADSAPRLDPSGLNGGPTIRHYPPVEVDERPLVPVYPEAESYPNSQSRRTETGSTNRAAAQAPIKQPSFVPFAKPEATTPYMPPANKLRLVPDPDAERLDLRRDEIPNLIQPGDRSTYRATTTNFASVPIQWPERQAVTPAVPAGPVTREMELAPPHRNFVPASISTEKLDDRGWKSQAQ